MVHARNRIIPVAADAAAYFFKEEIIFLVTTDGQRHVSDYHTLEELEHVLDPAHFFRANRQYILHLQSIESIRTHATGKLTVRLKPPLNREIDISREKAPSFKDWLG
jgi:DNA-binding LytR/AlgR family response regulator